MSNRPRTSPNQTVQSRQAKAKNSLKSKLSSYAINGATPTEHFASYVITCFPDTPKDGLKYMVKVLTYAYEHGKPIPTPNDMNKLFKHVIVTPSTIELNPRQNG